MWIEKRENGNFKFVERWKNPLTNKTQSVSCTFGKNNAQTRKKAQLILDEKIREKLVEVKSSETDITFSKLVDKYIDLAKEQLAYATWYGRQNTLNKIVKQFGKNLIARKITTQYLNKYFDSLIYEKGYANQTVSSYKSFISLVFKFGIKYGYLTKNPVDHVQVTWKSERLKRLDEIENKYLTDNEFEKIILDCEQRHRSDLKDFFTWLYLTGMRCGEAAALQKQNIYEDKNGNWFARVTGSLITYRKVKKDLRHKKSDGAKTSAGNREIMLPPEAVEIAKRHCKGKKAKDLIFVNEWPKSDGFFTSAKLDKVLKSIAKRQGIKKNLVTHIFRHTHVSKLAEMGVPLYVIQQRVGHGNSRITRQIYLHVTDAAQKDLAEKLAHFAPKVLPNSQKETKNNLKIVNKR